MKSLILGYYLLVISLGGINFHLNAAETQVDAKQAITLSLDKFHLAAANADIKGYFNLLSDNAVFLGTDATERWTKSEFREFVEPYFSKGKGWKYVSTERHISFLAGKDVAYFDELLSNSSYGTTRGSGVLIKTGDGWMIAQYNLSIPVPNGVAGEVVKLIKKR